MFYWRAKRRGGGSVLTNGADERVICPCIVLMRRTFKRTSRWFLDFFLGETPNNSKKSINIYMYTSLLSILLNLLFKAYRW